MNEEDKTGSLADQAAAWIPPWQRPVPASGPDSAALEVSLDSEAAAPDENAPDDDELEEQRPETDRLVDVAPDDDDELDEQRPETDRFVDVVPDAAPDDDDESDEQRPETDRLADVVPDAALDGSAPDEQRPDTDPAEISDLAGNDDLAELDVDAQFAEIVQSAADQDGMGDADQRTRKEVPSPVDQSDRPANLTAALEAILLVVDVPVATDVLAEVLSVSVAEAGAALAALSAEYTASGRGIDLRRAAGGWRLYTREDYARYVERFVLDGQSVRITQAALETLAVIAYQQPVTRSRMSAIRGVNCDGVVRTLANRGLIEECGTQPESGAFLYRTTPLFLEKLGLDSLDELPPLAPFLPDDVNGFVDA